MPTKMGSIKREYENSTCSRRDISKELTVAPVSTWLKNIPADAIVKEEPTSESLRYDKQLHRLIGSLHRLRHGRVEFGPTDKRVTYPLQPATFNFLQEHLSQSNCHESFGQWYHKRVRYDYDAEASEYTIRMPTAVHECFIAGVVGVINDAILELASSLKSRKGKARLALADALHDIILGGSTTVKLDSETNVGDDSKSRLGMVPIRRSPDASYYHRDAAQLPQMVLEVSYSQQRAQLSELAESYIVDSCHSIRCVIGIDIPYSNPNSPRRRTSNGTSSSPADSTATISIWRPTIVIDADGEETGISACHVDSLPFRNADKSPREGGLVLRLSDLLPQSTIDLLPKSTAAVANERIWIPFSQLTYALNKAEYTQETISSSPPSSSTTTTTTTKSAGTRSPPSTPTKFRKRKRLAPDELSDEREEFFLEAERAQMEKYGRADRPWRHCGDDDRNGARNVVVGRGGFEEKSRRASKRGKKRRRSSCEGAEVKIEGEPS